jgi:hypothetical protein
VHLINRLLSHLARNNSFLRSRHEEQLLLTGKLLSMESAKRSSIDSLAETEFRIFSQFGDDGIIQWLIHNLEIPNRTFIEFGVENYRESNTRFLMMNDNWSGFVMDGSAENVNAIIASEFYWRYQLTAKHAFIDTENINGLLSSSGLGPDIGILHVDLDGNDYWIWKQIDVVKPILVIAEYNSVFGPDRAITIPYDPKFVRGRHHHSNLYWGASLPALHHLATSKGYAFIGCNSAGNNAYFVLRHKLTNNVRETTLERGYVQSKYRESRDEQGKLTYVGGTSRLEIIRGLPVHNVLTGQRENL